ncbi:hypothetical protein C4J94_4313 [Pseudomonas sp. R5-89-07]|nr:hypothetical protein C4J94_4313 [Pseudomonas sp. R5-89-07]
MPLNMDSKTVPTLGETLKQLGMLQSALAQQLTETLELPLEQAFGRILKQPAITESHPFLNSFSDNLNEYLEQTGKKNNALCDSIIQCPAMQQADHSGILLDDEIFLNNLFFSMALSSKNIPYGLTIQCSTVKCISARAPLKGPLFLKDGNQPVRLSDLSNSQLKSRSFCNLPTPFQISISAPADQQDSRWKRLREMWNTKTFTCAEDAFIAINTELGKQIKYATGTEIVFLDERFTSFLAAKQLLNAQLPLADMIFDATLRSLILNIKETTIDSDDNFVLGHDLTDFFYFKSEQKLELLAIENCTTGAELILKRRSDGTVLARVGKRELVRMLEDGRLFCDRFLGYFVRCFGTGLKALGGTSQQDSVGLYQSILRKSNTQLQFMNTPFENLCFRDELTFLAGAPFFEGIDSSLLDSINQSSTDNLGSFIELIKTRKVKQLIGNFQSCHYLLKNAVKNKERQ